LVNSPLSDERFCQSPVSVGDICLMLAEPDEEAQAA
jgi:hypothetical protein